MISVYNPRTNKQDYTIFPLSNTSIQEKIAELRIQQNKWAALDFIQRAAILQTWKSALMQQENEIVDALATDTGREAISRQEFKSLLDLIDRWTSTSLPYLPAKSSAIPYIQAQQQDVPYSVVGVISPWNIPLLLAHIDAIPALMAGSAVVIKPSEITCRFIAKLVKTLVPELPILYLEGGAETGQSILEAVDLICFTGSTKTGKQVAATAAARMIPAFLELGGKDACIVLESANLDKATSGALWSAVVNSGQACQSLERFYVHENIYEQFIEMLVEKAMQITLNNEIEHFNSIGPAISAAQVYIWKEHLIDAVLKGGRILSGGEIHDFGGKWLYPTVISKVNHNMKVMKEETFGPLLPVMPFATTDEAIALANDSDYGLSASIYGEEMAAISLAKALNVGAISINDSGLTTLLFDAEKQSFNLSGLGGSRTGTSSIRRFFRRKALYINQNPQKNSWWF